MYILALDGGGAAGYVTVKLLERLEKELQAPTYQIFDLIAGVSTGSIIGAALAQGMPATELAQLYQTIIKQVFPKRSPNWFAQKWYSVRDLFKAKYSLDPVEKVLKNIFGENGEKVKLKSRFMCHTVKVTGEVKTVFWKSWNLNNTFNIVDAVMNSSSAPTFFKPRVINGEVYVDGAIASNCTAMCAISEAVRLDYDLAMLHVINIQTGDVPGLKFKAAKTFGGQLNWISEIAGLIITGGSETTEYQAHQLIDFRNHVIKPARYPGLDCQDFKLMDKLAEQMWAEHGKSLLAKLTPN